jgi:hypothetical protein
MWRFIQFSPCCQEPAFLLRSIIQHFAKWSIFLFDTRAKPAPAALSTARMTG